jgi:hypothetical protein
MSTTPALRREAKAMIDRLSPAQLHAAREFLVFVGQRDLDPATRELLATPGFAASYQRGLKDVAAGRTTPWRQVRDDV